MNKEKMKKFFNKKKTKKEKKAFQLKIYLIT